MTHDIKVNAEKPDSVLSNMETNSGHLKENTVLKSDKEIKEEGEMHFGDVFTVLNIKQEDLDNSDSDGDVPVQDVHIKSEFPSDSDSDVTNTLVQGYSYKLKKTYKCEVCKKKFLRKSILEKHVASHSEESQYHCKLCKKGFSNKFLLEAHTLTHAAKKPYECKICGKGLASEEYLRKHATTHMIKKPYICKICGKGVCSKQSLKAHAVIHTEKKPYTCQVCGKGLGRKDDLKTHAFTHLVKKPYTCEICGKGVCSKKSLKSHAQIHTLERPNQPKETNLGLGLYGIGSSTVKYTITTNPGESSYNCEICSSKFDSLDLFKAHVQSHMKCDVNVIFA